MKVTIDSVAKTGPYEYKWPGGDVERYDPVWEAVAKAEGRTYRIRHGVGQRFAFGRVRVRSVTWVNGYPTVEGVETEDYFRSRSLVSVLRRPDNTHVRDQSDLSADYANFDVVLLLKVITGPHVPASQAVRLVEDDLLGWATHALLRLRDRQRSVPVRPPIEPIPPDVPPAAKYVPITNTQRQAIVDGLLHFGSLPRTNTWVFTPDQEADRFVISNPFAFLIAVICDQGIVAERAWRVPYDLRLRLGHLDPVRISRERQGVGDAVQQSPALVRFVNKTPDWVVDAARRVVDEYGGDAGRIWSGEPTASTILERMDAFLGVGQKKAAMTVELLDRYLHVKIAELGGSDVAYDVHIRRVFLRTGLAELDTPEEVIGSARRSYPPRPGALDGPAWEIGRTWCRPSNPTCDACPIGVVCPRYVDRAAGVKGG